MLGNLPGRAGVRIFIIPLFVAVLFSSSAVPLAAQSSPDTPRLGDPSSQNSVMDRIRAKMREQEHDTQEEARRWFDNLDTDRNEEITKQELFESVRGRFETMDRNRDRYVTKPEYLGLRKDSSQGARRFDELDSNKDGRLSLEEFAAPADWRFDRIDRNLDGKISRQEAQRLFDRPVGHESAQGTGECFYVDRQGVRVNEETAELFKKRGYPKADCQWTPDVTDQEKTKKFIR